MNIPLASWPCLKTETRPEWIDDMGHVNIQYYYHLSAHAVFGMTERVLVAREPAPPARLFFTLESRILYKRELSFPEEIEAFVRPVSRTEKIVRVLIQIYGSRDASRPAALCELVGAYADPETRRIARLLESSKAIFDETVALGAAEPYQSETREPSGVLPAPGPRQRFVSFEGKIEPEWIDRMGHMGIEHYGLISERASRGLLRALGYVLPERRKQGLGGFALESRMKYLKEMPLGQPFKVVSWLVALGSKTAHYRHEILPPDAEPGGAAFATCDHTMAFADLAARRATNVPEDFRQNIDRLYAE